MPAAPLPRFLLLYGALFAAFGVASPFLPSLLIQRGLSPGDIGVVLGAGTAIRLASGPAACRLADRLGLRRAVLVLLTAVSAGVALGYLLPGGFAVLMLVGLLHAAALAPLVPLSDALSLGAAPGRFRYGWVRGAGSAAFVAGATGAGQVVAALGLPSIIVLNAALLGLAALAAALVPNRVPDLAPDDAPQPGRAGGAMELLRVPGFVRLMGVAALVLGSHALHDGFEVLRWRSAGIGPGIAGLLWSEAVLAEVVVFVLCGGWLLQTLGPRGAALLAAAAGVLRWSVTALTAAVPAMALTEPLHGLTFALLHLTCMKLIAETVPGAPGRHGAGGLRDCGRRGDVGAADAAVRGVVWRLWPRRVLGHGRVVWSGHAAGVGIACAEVGCLEDRHSCRRLDSVLV